MRTSNRPTTVGDFATGMRTVPVPVAVFADEFSIDEDVRLAA